MTQHKTLEPMSNTKTPETKLYTPQIIKHHAAGAVGFEEGGLFVWENANDVMQCKNKKINELIQQNRELVEALKECQFVLETALDMLRVMPESSRSTLDKITSLIQKEGK